MNLEEMIDKPITDIFPRRTSAQKSSSTVAINIILKSVSSKDTIPTVGEVYEYVRSASLRSAYLDLGGKSIQKYVCDVFESNGIILPKGIPTKNGIRLIPDDDQIEYLKSHPREITLAQLFDFAPDINRHMGTHIVTAIKTNFDDVTNLGELSDKLYSIGDYAQFLELHHFGPNSYQILQCEAKKVGIDLPSVRFQDGDKLILMPNAKLVSKDIGKSSLVQVDIDKLNSSKYGSGLLFLYMVKLSQLVGLTMHDTVDEFATKLHDTAQIEKTIGKFADKRKYSALSNLMISGGATTMPTVDELYFVR